MLRIIILPQGFVLVGFVEYDGVEIILHKPSIVRDWGTKDVGLGYLASHGPTPQTILDRGETDIRFERLAVIFQWDCKESAWGSYGGL